MKEIIFFWSYFWKSLNPLVNRACVCILLLAFWVVRHMLCSSLVHQEGQYFLVGAGASHLQTHWLNATENRELALPFKEFPSVLQDGVFALFIWWTGLFTMGYYNPSWLTTFFSIQVYFFCWATPCAMVLVNSVCSPSVTPVIAPHCCRVAETWFLSPDFCSSFFFLDETGLWIVRD